MRYFILLAVAVLLSFAKVDVNNVSAKDLIALKGIGAKKAKAIIEYRKNHCFKSIDDLLKVKGIGKGILKKNRDNIEIGKCKKQYEVNCFVINDIIEKVELYKKTNSRISKL